MSVENTDGIIDIEALELSQFATPKTNWVQDNIGLCPIYSAGTSRPLRKRLQNNNRLLSRFETLPLEIRMKIYGYLIYPIDGRVWLRVCDKNSCTPIQPCISCHYSQIDALRENGTTGNHGTREVRARIYGIYFRCPHTLVNFGCWLREYPQHYINFSRTSTEWVLLCVSKTLRTELLSLIFGKSYAIFDYELSSRAVHYNRWHWKGPLPPRECYWRMRLSTPLFLSLTKIHLRKCVGGGEVSRRPGFSDWNRRSDAHRVLTKQARSISFIANHFPALTSLVFEPHLPGVPESCGFRFSRRAPRINVKQSYLDGLVTAILELVRLCYCLETVHIPEGNVSFVHDAYLTYPSDRISWHTLDLVQVGHHLREDVAFKWAKQVIWKLKEHEIGPTLAILQDYRGWNTY